MFDVGRSGEREKMRENIKATAVAVFRDLRHEVTELVEFD